MTAWTVSVKGVVRHDGQVLLALNDRDEWELPGGQLERDESVPDCLRREVEEETGLAVSVGPLVTCYPFEVVPGRWVLIVAHACAVDGPSEVRISPEHVRLQWFHVDELPSSLPAGYRDAITRTFQTRAKDEAPRRPTVVCLCGSTRFLDAFDAASLRETLAGRIVLSIGSTHTRDVDQADDSAAGADAVRERLAALHRAKIDMADEVVVINVGGHIGTTTAAEIAHAQATGKPVRYWEPLSS